VTTGNELIIAGGGLAGCIAALVLAKLRPEVPVHLVESQPVFGGNHIWSFFDSDMPAEARWLVQPLVAHRWAAYDVLFPSRRRTLHIGYNSIFSERLDRAVRDTLGENRFSVGDPVVDVEPTQVRLASGAILRGRGVIDARGDLNLDLFDTGWQKFLGHVYELDRPHRLEHPIVMDATVDQQDGYRFVYCLPFTPTRILIEDTYYSLDSTLDEKVLAARIEEYMRSRGWSGQRLRRETGVLPVVMSGQLGALWRDEPGVPKIGSRGGFFHPTTGYSLQDAVRIAYLLARQTDFSSAALDRVIYAAAHRLWKQRRFYRMLNRLLFRAARPEERYRVLEHFYRLEPDVVSRFYAARSWTTDKFRIVSGTPPVPVSRALAALLP
jgi:lycopene beta-cyclase